MRAVLLAAAIVIAPLGVPAAPAAACPAPSIPVFPGARLPDGSRGPDMPVNAGNVFLTTPDTLLDVQRFYYTRLPNEGWVAVAQLPGQYISQFGAAGASTTSGDVAQGVLEFSRNDGHESVRIVGQAGGYSIYVDCRD